MPKVRDIINRAWELGHENNACRVFQFNTRDIRIVFYRTGPEVSYPVYHAEVIYTPASQQELHVAITEKRLELDIDPFNPAAAALAFLFKAALLAELGLSWIG